MKTENYRNKIALKILDKGTRISEIVKFHFLEHLFTVNPMYQSKGLGIRLPNNIQIKGNAKTMATVSITTRYLPNPQISKQSNSLILAIKDNGSGIPDAIKDKIFQPFFTAKPTGQGSGLGLSLSYDIVKAYGGKLKVETEEGEGAEFIIQLPI